MLGAIGAAVVGAVAWAAVLAGAHYEIGWLAWGIGAGIGAACVALGGRGTGLAVTCAVLAVVSIAAGKYAGYAVGAQGISEAAVRDHVSRDWYDEYARDAEGWAALGDDPTDQQIREYLVMHDWVETTDPAEIDAESVTEFASTEGPGLREFHRQQPTFDAWRDQVARDMANLVTESVSPTDAIIEDVNAFDLLFVFLGVSTAFGIVYKRSEQDAQASRRAARQAARAESAES